MASRLMSVQETGEQVVRAISKVLQVETALIDDEFVIVATSNGYFEKKGLQIHKPFVKNVFTKGIVIEKNPGKSEYCKGCRFENNCPETVEILNAIYLNNEVLGCFSILGFNEKQRDTLLRDEVGLLGFIGEMSKLLASALAEKESFEKIELANKKIEGIMDLGQEGIIVIDSCGIITNCNLVSTRQLNYKKSQLLGKYIFEFLADDRIMDVIKKHIELFAEEFRIKNKDHLFHGVISTKKLIIGNVFVGSVLSISDIDYVRSVAYNFSSGQREYSFDDIIGNSIEVSKLKEWCLNVASSRSTVLIQGESGTGKELIARAIHGASKRRESPFIAVNCAAIPETLLESELFGYEDGAFTGAKKGGKPGKIELANRGTLFLDEIGDLSLHLQPKLLRVLQEKRVERVGSTTSVPVDIRIISATHKNLEKMIAQNEFREDLFYRLNVLPIMIPPLRERREDILVLIKHFLKRFNNGLGKNVKGFSEEAVSVLMKYNWPGNIRELENVVEYAVNIETGDIINITSLPKKNQAQTEDFVFENCSLENKVKNFEKQIIIDTLKKHHNNVDGKKHAAKELGISLATLYRKCSLLGINDINK